MEAKPSRAFASIKQGLSEALEFAAKNERNAAIHKFTPTKEKEILEDNFECKGNNRDDSNN